jgi:tetratricopeptide (TPR) repeat protein
MANRARTQPGAAKAAEMEESKALENIEVFYEKNKKRINSITTIVLVVVVGLFAYFKLYKAPLEEKAATAMHFAQTYFQADSVDKALNGDGQHMGFLKIAKKYGGTRQANLCHYYTGVCYLHKGEFKKAINELEDFDGKGTPVQYAAYGLLGDAYVESGNMNKGIEYYNKAAGDKDNAALTPMYLLRAGLAYEKDNKVEDAKKAYLRIRDEYPNSDQAREIDKNLARLGVLN